MPARSKPVVELLTDTFRDWLQHRRELSEIRQLNTAEFDRIANELSVSPADLNELVRQGPHAADELPKLLDVLGIDEAALARTQPLVLRDMERVCALCQHKGQCERDLAAGTSADHYERYCLNASTIDLLEQEAGKPAV
jgi:transcriptional regulator with XRE-family HTH domain